MKPLLSYVLTHKRVCTPLYVYTYKHIAQQEIWDVTGMKALDIIGGLQRIDAPDSLFMVVDDGYRILAEVHCHTPDVYTAEFAYGHREQWLSYRKREPKIMERLRQSYPDHTDEDIITKQLINLLCRFLTQSDKFKLKETEY